MSTDIDYRRGDCITGALEWAAELPGATHVIAHGCNDIGAWGAGFTAALDSVAPYVGETFQSGGPRPLGSVQFVTLDDSPVVVANCVTQHGVGIRDGRIPFRYWALGRCLQTFERALERALLGRAYVHMPRIGCGLAGADWTQVEPYVAELAAHPRFEVIVWDLP